MTSHIRKFGAVGASTTLLGGAGSALLLALAASPAGAVPATFTVDTLDDGAATASDCTTPVVGSCSLRDALAAASTGDTIVFATSLFAGGPGTITMDSGEGEFDDDGVNIQGPGASLLTVQSTGSHRVFYLRTEVTGTTISGMTITGGDAGTDDGGGLYDENSNYLILNDVVITGNTTANSGGGVKGGRIKLTNSVVSGNTATDGANGGGAGIYATGDVYIANSTIAGNTTQRCGGGLYVGANEGNIVIMNSTFSDNTAVNCYGGAIDVDGQNNSVMIMNSTFTGNTAVSGGGIHVDYDNTVGILFTTITGNTSTSTGEVYYSGGGLHLSDSGTVYLQMIGTIVAGNTAGTGGTADIAAGSMQNNSITGASTTSKGKGVAAAGSVTILAGFSMIGTGAAVSPNITLTGPGNVRGDDPMLGALGDNGGPTPTMLPMAGSPVIDAGPAAADVPDFPGEEFDQRGPGFPRIIGTSSDIGAVEVKPAEPEPVVPAFTG